ncbi:MAG TPA: ABC transporter ATP-binding protein [Desulfobacterales bacterium]|nr:ABC transporter ATP-binding protein [Desulfobacterales bacterium]
MTLSKQQQPVSLKIEDLHISFGTTKVLQGINLSIKPGEFFAFLGPSGSGKSTLLRAIAGFGPTPEGRILINDEDIALLPPWKRDVGMVFQNYALWPHMSVKKNVAFGLEERKVAKTDIPGRVKAALDMVGLAHLADRHPAQLSGGQQQRVALARTIVVQPRILLLDEPLSNLDANLRVQMRNDIRKLQRKLGLTTIFVTHDQEEANTISDRMAVLDKGVIQQIGSPMDLYDNPVNQFVAHFLGTTNLIEGKVSGKDGSSILLTDSGVTIPIDTKAETGKKGAVVFRPQSIHINPETDITESVELTGTVESKEFLGSTVRYSITVGSDTILVEEDHQRGKPVFSENETVRLFIPENQILFIELESVSV